jgi:hypothetical protein
VSFLNFYGAGLCLHTARTQDEDHWRENLRDAIEQWKESPAPFGLVKARLRLFVEGLLHRPFDCGVVLGEQLTKGVGSSDAIKLTCGRRSSASRFTNDVCNHGLLLEE